ncbi:MAG: 4-(cytidine 5'-diphospho)-2-C-methyl-D-erythritol kinase [Chitinophagaceae bacterium]|nr:MAG: 4-(cytidine 5'-diphospho)-2-C-methyl-D-erythritol kinase [Chitinophagaceae bacterium]
MIVFPNAKINLGLFITEKRPDGFHNLESVFLPVNWFDVLEIIPSKKFSLNVSGRVINCKTEDNLIFKAWNLLQSDFGIQAVETHLIKNIPMGAGLGGGSSDAAFMLKALNTLFELNLNDTQLEKYATMLGSDCPFFIRNKAALAYDKGNKLKELDLNIQNEYTLVIIWPEIFVSTKEAYSQIIPKKAPANWTKGLQNIVKWKEFLNNDFESTVFSSHSEIKDLKEQMYQSGAIYASMSGSGSSVFGIFDKNRQIDKNTFKNVHSENINISKLNYGRIEL